MAEALQNRIIGYSPRRPNARRYFESWCKSGLRSNFDLRTMIFSYQVTYCWHCDDDVVSFGFVISKHKSW